VVEDFYGPIDVEGVEIGKEEEEDGGDVDHFCFRGGETG
jgi:hypothetical protein